VKWWLTKYFADHVDVIHMYAEMCNDQSTQMPLKFQYSLDPTWCITTPTDNGTSHNPILTKNIVTHMTFWVLNVPCQAFAWVVWLAQNTVPHAWVLNMSPNCQNNCTCNLHKHSEVAQLRVALGKISKPKLPTSMIYSSVRSYTDHMKCLTVSWILSQSEEPSS